MNRLSNPGRILAAAIVLCFVCMSSWSLGPEHTREQARVRSSISANPVMANVPVAFERNRGQADPNTRFVMHDRSMVLLVSDRGLTLADSSQQRDVVVALEFKGAKTQQLRGERQLKGRANYLIGNRPEYWVLDVPRYESVRYQALYPGIDADIYFNHSNLEYDFVVAPGATPDQVRLGFEGVERLRLDNNGDLLLNGAGRYLRQRKPVAYQQVGGKKIEVDVRYALSGHEVSFAVGSYDRTKELVIDPVLVYATFLGGAGDAGPTSIAVDAAGAAYIAGTTTSLNLPITAGSLQPRLGGGTFDAFVAKLNPQGTGLEYMTYLGGSGFDFANGLAIDSAGNAYLAGRTGSANFPGTFLTTSGSLPSLPSGVNVDQAFVTKINVSGSAVVYSVRFGGNDVSQFPVGPNGTVADAIAVDSSGNAYVTGMTGAFEFPITTPIVPGTPLCNRYGLCTSFVTKINAAGTALVFSSLLGGGPGSAIAVDANGNVFVAGRGGPPPTPNAVQNNSDGAFSSGFVSKINPSGTALVYSAVLGGQDQAYCTGIAIDAAGNAYVTGATTNTDFPTTAGAFLRTKGSADFVPFASKLNPTGTELLYSTFLISAPVLSESSGKSIAVDSFGNAYIVGETNAPSLAVTPDAVQKTVQGTTANPYLVKLNSSGSGFLFATYFGGTADVCCNTAANSVALDAADNAFMTGVTSASDFPATSGAFQTKLPEKTANFAAKFAVGPDFALAASPQSASVSPGQSATYQLAITPQYGFDGQVNLSCSGLPAGASCSFTPASVSAGSPVSSTLIITTSTGAVSMLRTSSRVSLALLTLPLFGTLLLSGSRVKKTAARYSLLAVALILLSLAFACGGVTKPSPSPSPNPTPTPSPTPTPAGTYQVVVTGSSALVSLQHSATVQLTVQ